MTDTFFDLVLDKQKYDAQFKVVKQLVPAVFSDEYGRYEDDDGNNLSAEVTDNINYVWCRAYGDAPPAPVLNKNKVPPITGMPVYIGYNEESSEIEVLGINKALLNESESIPNTTVHYRQHLETGYDPLPLMRRMRGELKTTPGSSGLAVNVSSLEYDDNNGDRQVFGGINGYDISVGKPAAGLARYVLIYLNIINGNLAMVNGSTVIDSMAVVPPKADTPENGIASAYVRLDGTQTSIVNGDISEGRRFLLPKPKNMDLIKMRVFN